MLLFNRQVLPTRRCHLLAGFKTIFPLVKRVMVIFCIGLCVVRRLKIVTVVDKFQSNMIQVEVKSQYYPICVEGGSNENNEEWVDCYYLKLRCSRYIPT